MNAHAQHKHRKQTHHVKKRKNWQKTKRSCKYTASKCQELAAIFCCYFFHLHVLISQRVKSLSLASSLKLESLFRFLSLLIVVHLSNSHIVIMALEMQCTPNWLNMCVLYMQPQGKSYTKRNLSKAKDLCDLNCLPHNVVSSIKEQPNQRQVLK